MYDFHYNKLNLYYVFTYLMFFLFKKNKYEKCIYHPLFKIYYIDIFMFYKQIIRKYQYNSYIKFMKKRIDYSKRFKANKNIENLIDL